MITRQQLIKHQNQAKADNQLRLANIIADALIMQNKGHKITEQWVIDALEAPWDY